MIRMNVAMARAAVLGLALVALALPVRAHAEGPPAFRVISPIFGQLVTFSMPSNFLVVFENTKDGRYIREAVLKGESVERWTQMITVTGAKGLSSNPNASPEKFAASIANGFKAACPDTFAAKAIGNARLGAHDAFIAVVGCGAVGAGADRHSEIALIAAVKGAADYYTIQWAERGPASDKPDIDAEKWPARFRQLHPIDFCPIVPGEAPPYPSCVSKG